MRFPVAATVAIGALLATAAGLQAARDRLVPGGLMAGPSDGMLYVRSGEFATRAALSFDAVVADIYWMRAVQYFGSTKLAGDPSRRYALLYPLLDLTTTLDPHFNLAYRFGAIFLAEPYPGGAGRPDQAIALLEKGRRAQPDRWEFVQDIGFIHYWWLRDYPVAAEWFRRGAAMPGGPAWLQGMAAVTLAEGGNRESSRRLWQEIAKGSDAEWLVGQAQFRLKQLDAMDEIDALQQIVARYKADTGSLPPTWDALIRAGYLSGVPVDSERHVYSLNPYWGVVALAESSPLNPLPLPERSPR